MPQEQSLLINFAQGLDTKTDPWQVPAGKFLSLVNAVFSKGDLLTKRPGYALLPTPPSGNYLTTLNNNLLTIGTTINAYSAATQSWITKGYLQPVSLSVLPVLRNNLNQVQADAAVASNGLVCTVYTQSSGGSNTYYYVVADSVTGQNIIAPTALAANATYGSPKVFVLGAYFVVVYATTAASPYNLAFIAVSTSNPAAIPIGPTTITGSYAPSTSGAFDGVVFNNKLYLAWNGYGSTGIRMAYVSAALIVSATFNSDPSHQATLINVCADATNGTIWVTSYNSGPATGYAMALNTSLTLFPSFPVQIISSGVIANLAAYAQNGVLASLQEVLQTLSGVNANYVQQQAVIQSTAVVGGATSLVRSVGLASKAFIVNGIGYFLAAYSSPDQPTYFLINASQNQQNGPVVVAKVAYQNGVGYLGFGLPGVSVYGNKASISYLFKQNVQSINTQNNTQQITTGNIYSQLGVNLVTFELGTRAIETAEIGGDLHLSGGYLGMFDGFYPVEHNFFLFPEGISAVWSATGGAMHAQPDGATNTDAYYYQVTYEWTDQQGNAFKSQPSIALPVTTTGSGTAGIVTLTIPMLRLTAKTPTPVKIVIYRWSVQTQAYNQVTSITSPQLNVISSDTLTYVDTLADASVIGNNIIYTTGGVAPDTNGPASNIMTLFDTRLWLVDAEDPNLLWVSKTVIEAVPVEMSSLFTVYVAPNTGTVNSTGPITALAPMDDKLIIFKADAIYYINGTGPDNLGTTAPGCPLGSYSPATFITTIVGCTNPASIVMTQNGLMFQTDKGIWSLSHELSAQYIGAPVEAFNSSVVLGANVIQGTNYVLFPLNTGETLMYDFYYGQWGTFSGVPTLSACIYNGLHTVLTQYAEVMQETPGLYADGLNPVLMSFTTAWFGLAGLQGYERFYEFLILAKYISPHTLTIGTAYDFNPSSYHQSTVSPSNFNPSAPSGFGIPVPYGANEQLEQWRVHAKRQTCQSFQLSIKENFNPALGTAPGAGFTMSGINCKVGLKKARRPIRGADTVG